MKKVVIVLSLVLIFIVPIIQANSGDQPESKEDKEQVAHLQHLLEEEKFDEALGVALRIVKPGDGEIEHSIALLVSNGFGDYEQECRDIESLFWIQRAANSGHEDSVDWLIDTHVNGWFGLSPDPELAACLRRNRDTREIQSCFQEIDRCAPYDE